MTVRSIIVRMGLSSFLCLILFTACEAGGGESGDQKDMRQEEPEEGNATFPYRIEAVAENLEVPWDMEAAPDGTIYFTERPGRIRLIREGRLLEKPLVSLEERVHHGGEGGLLGLALDPAFSENGYLYVYHTYEQQGEVRNRVLRMTVSGERVTEERIIIEGLPGARNHNGGRVKFGPDGMLYVTAGDIYNTALAQDPDSLGGKILRIRPDGIVPEDNPFPDSPVYSLGHRNPQGLDWHPESGALFSSEHGQTAHDEINIIEAGNNYGWPVIEGGESAEGLVKPLVHSGSETWAPSGITFLRKGPWARKLLVANLRGEQILKLSLTGTGDKMAVSRIRPLFAGEWGRIRNVYEAPDGSVYVMTHNRDGRGTPSPEDDRIIRWIPVHP